MVSNYLKQIDRRYDAFGGQSLGLGTQCFGSGFHSVADHFGGMIYGVATGYFMAPVAIRRVPTALANDKQEWRDC